MTRRSTSLDDDRRRARQAFKNHFNSPKAEIPGWVIEIAEEVDPLFHDERYVASVHAMIRQSAEERAAELEKRRDFKPDWTKGRLEHRAKLLATTKYRKPPKNEDEAAIRKAVGPPPTPRAKRWTDWEAGPPKGHPDWVWLEFHTADIVPVELEGGKQGWAAVNDDVRGWGPPHLQPDKAPPLRAPIPEDPTMAEKVFALAGLHDYAAFAAEKIDPWAEDDLERNSVAAVAYVVFGRGPVIDAVYEAVQRRFLREVQEDLVQRFGGPPPHSPKKDVERSPLTPNQNRVLVALAEKPDVTMIKVEIAETTKTSESALKKPNLLPFLSESGLIHRPHGQRSGYALTEKGRSRIPAGANKPGFPR